MLVSMDPIDTEEGELTHFTQNYFSWSACLLISASVCLANYQRRRGSSN